MRFDIGKSLWTYDVYPPVLEGDLNAAQMAVTAIKNKINGGSVD